jgi:hypothetical protein
MNNNFNRLIRKPAGIALACLLCIAPAWGLDFEVDGIRYRVNSTNVNEVSVTSGGNYSGDIIIPEEVTYDGTVYVVLALGERAFSDCSSLASVSIPSSVTTIEMCAFANCSSLASVSIPSSVTTIGYQAFFGCSSLASVSIPSSVTTIRGQAFYRCSSLASVVVPSSVTTIEKLVFWGCSSLADVSIPGSVTTIEEYAFHACSSLADVSIPGSVTTIGQYAFSYCSSLASVAIPGSVTTIEHSVFKGCSSLVSVTIPNSVTAIGKEAFWACHSLASVTLPGSVTTIGEGAFSRCSSLADVTVEWATPLSVSGWTFSLDTPVETATLHVPAGTKALYEAAEVWKDFGTIKEDAPAGVLPTAPVAYVYYSDGLLGKHFHRGADCRLFPFRISSLYGAKGRGYL